MEWIYLLIGLLLMTTSVNVVLLLIGDDRSMAKHRVPLARPRDYNEEAKNDGVEREALAVDVLFVGAGPAGLAGAYHLARLAKQYDRAIEAGERTGDKLGELQVAVLEKCSEIGAMGISGMVLDPRALRELVPDFESRGAPLGCQVEKESMHFLLGERRSMRLPLQPPPLRDRGLYVGSLAKLVRWMAGLCEEQGVLLFPGFAGAYPIYDGDRVVGVRTGDKGIDANGQKKPSFQPGIDLSARVTVLAEGARGSLTRDVVRRLGLDSGKNPQSYSVGVKEVIEVSAGRMRPGEVVLTAGWPLDRRTFGGSFLYAMENNLVSVGLVVGLDYRDPTLDPQLELQRMKTHPLFRKYLENGKVVEFGAKTIPEGGWFAMPRPYADGLLLAGDTAGFLNAERLKGVHLAIKTGMLAAETALEALVAKDTSARKLSSFQPAVERSWVGDELWKARNFHSNFREGLVPGFVRNALHVVFGEFMNKKFPRATENDFETKRKLAETEGPRHVRSDLPRDSSLVIDKLDAAYLARSKGNEDQPPHLQVLDLQLCAARCREEFDNPCTHACPVNVYEMVDDEKHPGEKRLHLNPTNCVHCKTCDLIDPFINIRWVVPEGGDGPNYSVM